MNVLYVKDCKGSPDAVGDRLEAASKAHDFGVLNQVDLKEKMNSKGVEFDATCRVYEICNPQRAKEVLERDLSISTALPCRVSLYEEEGTVKLATMLPTVMIGLFGAEDLSPIAEAVERDIKAIMDEAAGTD